MLVFWSSTVLYYSSRCLPPSFQVAVSWQDLEGNFPTQTLTATIIQCSQLIFLECFIFSQPPYIHLLILYSQLLSPSILVLTTFTTDIYKNDIYESFRFHNSFSLGYSRRTSSGRRIRSGRWSSPEACWKHTQGKWGGAGKEAEKWYAREQVYDSGQLRLDLLGGTSGRTVEHVSEHSLLRSEVDGFFFLQFPSVIDWGLLPEMIAFHHFWPAPLRAGVEARRWQWVDTVGTF